MLRVDLDKCTGCRRCETTCAFYHTGRVNNHLARTKVIHLYESGVDGPVVCQQCKERYCLKCPENALALGSHGQVIASPTVCTLCGACEINCPIGAIELFNGIVYVCDLCGGDPKCVEACTENAIIWEMAETEKVSLAEIKKESMKLSPGEKRHLFISKQGEALRKAWRKTHA